MSWETYTIDIEEVKEYLKVEHDLEDKTIGRITSAAIQKASQRINRDFSEIPPDVELAIFKMIAYWYENRTDTNNIPAEAEDVFKQYYFWPGL